MKIKIRSTGPADVEACGRIIYESFKSVADQYGFPCDFPSIKTTTQLARMLIMNNSFFSIVAENEGAVVGCNFLNEGHPIRSIGPTCVDPGFQNRGIGRQLMKKVLERAQGSLGIRLIQETPNITSLSLYTSLGFEIKNLLLLVKGRPKNTDLLQGIDVHPLKLGEEKLCAEICLEVCGFERTNDVKNAIKYSSPFGAMRGGKLIAYSSSMTSWMTNHCVAKTDEDMKALIQGIGKQTSEPLSFLLPSRYTNFYQWCLIEGFRIVKPFTLMAVGHYCEPNGNYFPSVSF
jgi:GNAT superfamily N-acetyltransferase